MNINLLVVYQEKNKVNKIFCNKIRRMLIYLVYLIISLVFISIIMNRYMINKNVKIFIKQILFLFSIIFYNLYPYLYTVFVFNNYSFAKKYFPKALSFFIQINLYKYFYHFSLNENHIWLQISALLPKA